MGRLWLWTYYLTTLIWACWIRWQIYSSPPLTQPAMCLHLRVSSPDMSDVAARPTALWGTQTFAVWLIDLSQTNSSSRTFINYVNLVKTVKLYHFIPPSLVLHVPIIWLQNQKRRDHSEELGVDGKVKLSLYLFELSTASWSRIGEWSYSSKNSWPRH
jgi:hypothetical protein